MRGPKVIKSPSKTEWTRLRVSVVALAKASRYGPKQRRAARLKLNQILEVLSEKYPFDPSVVATVGEFCPILVKKRDLYLRAYRLAQHRKDNLNAGLISADLARFYLDHPLFGAKKAGRWIERLREALKNHEDDYCRMELGYLDNLFSGLVKPSGNRK